MVENYTETADVTSTSGTLPFTTDHSKLYSSKYKT